MKYKQRRRLYSQNYLRSPKLINKLIRNSSIGKNDTVIEIGPGKGIITDELLKVTKKVIAIDLDQKLCLHLHKRFENEKSLNIVNKDFLEFELPDYPFKVFSNIPFSITADIIRKLTSSRHLTETYLIVQKEAAKKFIGMPVDNRNQMMSTLLKPWFDIKIVWSFRRFDFIPVPKVNIVMINIKRKVKPDLPYGKKNLYEHFAIYEYNRHKVSRMNYKQFITKFKEFDKTASAQKKREALRHANIILTKQANIKKVHRTRVSKYRRVKC